MATNLLEIYTFHLIEFSKAVSIKWKVTTLKFLPQSIKSRSKTILVATRKVFKNKLGKKNLTSQ